MGNRLLTLGIPGRSFDPRRVSPGNLKLWFDSMVPGNGGVALADGDGVTIWEDRANPGNAFYDPFTRANSATTMGNGWTTVGGTWGISSNLAYVAVSSSGNDRAIRETGLSDCMVRATFTTSVADQRLLFRHTDAQNEFIVRRFGATAYRLDKREGNVESNIGAYVVAPADGDVISVSLSGSSITVYLNNTARITATDTFNQTATKHGFGGVNSTVSRFDDFVVAKLTDAVQTTAASKPTYKINILNGKPVVRFDGGDMLNCADVLDSVFAGASAKYTMYFVATSTTAAVQAVIGKFDAAAGERGVTFGFRNNGAALHLDIASVDRGGTNYLVQRGGTDVLSTFTVASMTFDATEATNVNRQKIYRNGSAETLTAVLSGTGIAEDNAALLTIGATAGGASYLTGDIRTIILYNELHSTAQQTRVQRWLARDTALTITV